MRDNFRTLDLNLLRVFDALMAEGNVTRTAKRLALTQSAVSNALGRLRFALGDTLFIKTQTGIRPTATARELWAVMGQHFTALREAVEPSTFSPLAFSGSICMAMSDYTVERVMPRLSAHLCEHAPGLRIDQVPYSVANLSTLFDKEGVDLAIGAYLNDASPISGIRSHTLWPIHSSCLMRRDHPLASAAMTLERFLNARHIDVLLPGMYMPLYDSLLSGHGLKRNLVLTLNHYTQALPILRQTDCIGVLPTSLLDSSPLASGMVSIEPPIPMPVRPFGLMWHQRRETDPAQSWLRETIVSMFSVKTPSREAAPLRQRPAAKPTARAARKRPATAIKSRP